MPTDDEIAVWLSAGGIDAARVLPGSVQGHRIADSQECRLLFVEDFGDGATPRYLARSEVLPLPAWLAARVRLPAAQHAAMGEYLRSWLRKPSAESDQGAA